MRRRWRTSGLRLAADIGGTFTDVAVFDDRSGELRFGKVLSTSQHLPDGIAEGVGKAGCDVSATDKLRAKLALKIARLRVLAV